MRSILAQTKQSERIPNKLRTSLNITKQMANVIYVVSKTALVARMYNAWNISEHPLTFPVLQQAATEWISLLNIDVIVHGEIPTETALRVSNHITWVDPVVLTSVVPSKLISKAEVQDYPILGKLLTAAHFIYVKRGETDAMSVGKLVAHALENKRSVMFFPEATTNDGTRVHKIYGKLFMGALLSGSPVQPYIIIYQKSDGSLDTDMWWRKEENLLENALRVFRHTGTRAHVKAGKPINPKGHTLESITIAVKESMDIAYNQLHQEIFGYDVESLEA